VTPSLARAFHAHWRTDIDSINPAPFPSNWRNMVAKLSGAKMSARSRSDSRQRHARHAHARMSAADVRSGGKIGLFVLVIIFIAVTAILLRLAEFAGRPVRHVPPPIPAAAVSEIL
jgi:hypothetical protein